MFSFHWKAIAGKWWNRNYLKYNHFYDSKEAFIRHSNMSNGRIGQYLLSQGLFRNLPKLFPVLWYRHNKIERWTLTVQMFRSVRPKQDRYSRKKPD